MQLLKIRGVVTAGESIFTSTRRRNTPRKLVAGYFLRALEHHMLQHMGYPCAAIHLVRASCLVPDLRDHHRGAMIFLDDQLKTVAKRILMRSGNGGCREQRSQQNQYHRNCWKTG